MSFNERIIYKVVGLSSNRVEMPVTLHYLKAEAKVSTTSGDLLILPISSAGVFYEVKATKLKSPDKPDLIDKQVKGILVRPENDPVLDFLAQGDPVRPEEFDSALREVLNNFSLPAMVAGYLPKIARVETWPINEKAENIAWDAQGAYPLGRIGFTSGFVFEERYEAISRMSFESGLDEKIAESKQFFDTLGPWSGRNTEGFMEPGLDSEDAKLRTERLHIGVTALGTLEKILQHLPYFVFINPPKLKFPLPAELIAAWAIAEKRFPDFSVDHDYRRVLRLAIQGYFQGQRSSKLMDRRKYLSKLETETLRLLTIEEQQPPGGPGSAWDF